jgi:hypothetical protein
VDVEVIPERKFQVLDLTAQSERIHEFVITVFEALGIPADETFEALFVTPEQQVNLVKYTDR